MGLRYRQYCANIVRTMLVDPSQELQDIYTILIEAEQKMIETLKPGTIFLTFFDIFRSIF